MQKLRAIAICLALSVPAAATSASAGDTPLSEGVNQLAVYADEIDWKPCAPGLPAGCEIAVLEGDPQGEGLFTVRFRVSEEFKMAPHTHPREERVTLLSGAVSVAFGADASHDGAITFGPGDYYVNARGVVHSVWADAPSILQITGTGPWRAEFVD